VKPRALARAWWGAARPYLELVAFAGVVLGTCAGVAILIWRG